MTLYRKSLDYISPVTGPQIRAGRALLGMSQPALAEVAGLCRQTIANVEGMRRIPPGSGEAIETAFNDLGVDFVSGGAVVREDR